MDIKVIVAIFANLAVLSLGSSWNYGKKGPATWAEHYPECEKSNQSPIDIKSLDTEIDCKLPIVDRELFSTPPTKMSILNNGHTVVIVVEEGGYVISDPELLPFDAKIVQWHFHWGNGSDGQGSEHKLNGRRYFAELHAVHYNTKYKDIEEAIAQPDGLAVFAWFIDDDYPQDNQDIQMFLKIAKKGAKRRNKAVDVEKPYSLETLLPPNLDKYFRYKGSLTTPPCFESVTWTVFKDPIRISRKQADLWATSFYASGRTLIQDNFRPIQALNGRIVTRPASLVQSCKAAKE